MLGLLRNLPSFAVAPPPAVKRQAPNWREVVDITANGRGVTIAPEKADDMAARAAMAGSAGAGIRYLELEFSQIDLAALDASIDATRRELSRLRSRRRRRAAAS